jgi:hypothetical protein
MKAMVYPGPNKVLVAKMDIPRVEHPHDTGGGIRRTKCRSARLRPLFSSERSSGSSLLRSVSPAEVGRCLSEHLLRFRKAPTMIKKSAATVRRQSVS